MSHAGTIVLWSGAIIDIPPGWVLCDGNNGSPDLRNRFIVGAGDTYVPNDTGGANTHNHDFSGSGHNHTISPGIGIQAGTGRTFITDTKSALGTTDPGTSLPLYYSLAYIMKT